MIVLVNTLLKMCWIHSSDNVAMNDTINKKTEQENWHESSQECKEITNVFIYLFIFYLFFSLLDLREEIIW